MMLNLQKVEYILFDWDNTLAESRTCLVATVNEILKKYNLPDWEQQKEKRNPNLSFRDNFPNVFGEINAKQAYLEYTENLFAHKDEQDNHGAFLRKTGLLGEDTAPQNATHEYKQKYVHDIQNDKLKFITASFAELFTSPARRVQIFFTDLFGIAKTYNRPGTTNGNWSLRLGENFEEDYYKAASEGKAPNFPQAIATALRQRGLDKGNEELMQKLDSSAKIIEEK